eukprot:m.55969 g.55969  ORF g.55969 m.55969 type:complete len:336 (+) comp34528_c1_seq1:315-1322(+)
MGGRQSARVRSQAGASYMDIHKAGGGIGYTVEQTHRASEDHLYSLLKDRLDQMKRAGTTLVECKSGYGLTKDVEVKMLRVIERARRDGSIGVVATFCGAHSIPKGKTEEEATADVINVQLPEICRLIKDGQLHVDNIDVFCEKGVFGLESTRQILTAGKAAGFDINFHGDELNPTHSAELGAELGARAISHLEEISDEGIAAMAKSESVAVLLPTTAYMLRLKQPPARKMIENGVIIGLGSDFNPNAFCLSMPLVMHLACVNMHLTLPEALAAATINAAAALGQSDKRGSLEIGKMADMVIIKAPRWEHIVYQLGCHSSIIKHVIKEGHIIHTSD